MAVELLNHTLFNDANLVSYYRFNSGALTTDSKGSNTLTNNNTVGETASGKFGYDANFGTTNTNKYFSRAGNLGLSYNTAFTLMFWVKIGTAPSTGATQNFGGNLFPSATLGVYNNLYYSNPSGTKQITFQRYASTNALITTNLDLGTTDYHLIAATWNGSQTELIVDGISKGTASSSGSTDWSGGGSGFQIGRYIYSEQAQYLTGNVDDFAVFSRALSSTEVSNFYNFVVPGGGSPIFFRGGFTLGSVAMGLLTNLQHFLKNAKSELECQKLIHDYNMIKNQIAMPSLAL